MCFLRRGHIVRCAGLDGPEERRVAIQHDHRTAAVEGVAPGFKAAPPGEELRILRGRIGVDLRGLRIALPAHRGRGLARVGEDRAAVALAVGTEDSRGLVALRAQGVGLRLGVRAHPLVHRVQRVVGRQDALDADIEDVHAKALAQFGGDHRAQARIDRIAAGIQQVGQLVRLDLGAQRGVDHRRHLLRGLQFVAGCRAVIDIGVGHAPTHEEAGPDRIVIGGGVILGRGLQQDRTGIVDRGALHERDLGVQPGAEAAAVDAAELGERRGMAVADQEQGGRAGQREDRDDDRDGGLHGPFPFITGPDDDADGTGGATVAAPAGAGMPCDVIAWGGNCTITLPPPVLITTWFFDRTSCIACNHSRWRVAAGATWYCASTWSKRATSACAAATVRVRYASASARITAASARASATSLSASARAASCSLRASWRALTMSSKDFLTSVGTLTSWMPASVTSMPVS